VNLHSSAAENGSGRVELITALSLLAGTGESPHRSQLAIAARETIGNGDPALLSRLARLWKEDPSSLGARLTAARSGAAAAVESGRRGGLTPILSRDARYPARLATIYDPPPLLWCRGDPARLDVPAVALVGARAASAYALEVAEQLGEGLARRGLTVVSGLARGVDAASHRGALAGGGATIAVLGSGADVIYPSEHRELAEAIAAAGVVLSELPPGSTPRPEHFPLRNRIISGLSMAVVIVEASERSGSLITARMALEQGREVMAVPGNVLTPRNRGSHALLRDGAKLVEGVDDILEELGASARTQTVTDGKTLVDDPLLSLMDDGEAYAVEELEALTGTGATALLPRLLELEMSGQVARREAGRFVRVRKGC
jgi:DNA processing protein